MVLPFLGMMLAAGATAAAAEAGKGLGASIGGTRQLPQYNAPQMMQQPETPNFMGSSANAFQGARERNQDRNIMSSVLNDDYLTFGKKLKQGQGQQQQQQNENVIPRFAQFNNPAPFDPASLWYNNYRGII